MYLQNLSIAILITVIANGCPGVDSDPDRPDQLASVQQELLGTQGKSDQNKIPGDVLGAWNGESLPAAGLIESWPSIWPAIDSFIPIGDLKVEAIAGHRFALIEKKQANGFSLGTFTKSIPCKGASIIAVVRPVRCRGKVPWTSIVDIFYDRLTIGIHNNTGLVCIHVNGNSENSEEALPDQRIAILSLVVKPEGSYTAYANGAQIMSGKSEEDMTSLEPGVAGPFANAITIGRNDPDPWTTFNGGIGAVYLYKKALSSAERQMREEILTKAFSEIPSIGGPAGQDRKINF